MCQLPLMRMCVARMRSPEKCISSHLPRDSTCSIVRPVSGALSCTADSGAYAVSNAVTCFPARACCRARAARKMVSPSGMVLGLRAGGLDGREQAAHAEAEGRCLKACVHEKAGEEVKMRGLSIDGGDEQAAAMTGFVVAHLLLCVAREKCGQIA